MKHPVLMICSAILLAFCQLGLAGGQAYEYHHDAVMQLQTGDSIQGAHGYVYVATDKKGHGVIQVMFSNATRLDNARFNAQVRFFDAEGTLLREEWFSRHIAAADNDGAAEDRLSRLVDLSEFATLKIELYLSDIPRPAQTALLGNTI